MSSQHQTLEDARLRDGSRKVRPLKREWLSIDTLPDLLGDDGRPLSRESLDWLLTTQQKHKAIEAADNTAPWFAMLESNSAKAFSAAVLDRFLASPQEAKDRFALTLAGLLGDDAVIDRLASPIQSWCEASRHKLAEYAADAIALLGSDAALMTLDALRVRYRSKFRNVGAAAERAFHKAADVRGISTDELGDMVMPALDFVGDDCRRRFEWADGGAIEAEIGIDWKLLFHGCDGSEHEGKSWKKLPAFVPAETAVAIKAVQKQVRDAAKGQTRRLELGLVRGRRWSKARFAELFIDHALGRTFASRLVLGVFGSGGALLRSCRRYPNGILADATGNFEELEEPEAHLGFVHPLELDADTRAAWTDHLARNKVKQPFPQLDRRVVDLDPSHGNRRELTITRGRTVSAGTFRSRLERLGWTRGSVVDAGGIPNYWKEFPGCGIEAMLDVDQFYIGIDPMEQVELQAARFVRAQSVDRGSYVYDDPSGDDPRIVRFGDVPPVVYSEITADLKTLVGDDS